MDEGHDLYLYNRELNATKGIDKPSEQTSYQGHYLHLYRPYAVLSRSMALRAFHMDSFIRIISSHSASRHSRSAGGSYKETLRGTTGVCRAGMRPAFDG